MFEVITSLKLCFHLLGWPNSSFRFSITSYRKTRMNFLASPIFYQLNLHQEGSSQFGSLGYLFLFVVPPISLFVTTSQHSQRKCAESLSSNTLRLGKASRKSWLIVIQKFLHGLQDSGVQLLTIISSALSSTIKSGFV